MQKEKEEVIQLLVSVMWLLDVEKLKLLLPLVANMLDEEPDQS